VLERPKLTVKVATVELERVLEHVLETGEKKVEIQLIVETA